MCRCGGDSIRVRPLIKGNTLCRCGGDSIRVRPQIKEIHCVDVVGIVLE